MIIRKAWTKYYFAFLSRGDGNRVSLSFTLLSLDSIVLVICRQKDFSAADLLVFGAILSKVNMIFCFLGVDLSFSSCLQFILLNSF
jgi:hypothetical protein